MADETPNIESDEPWQVSGPLVYRLIQVGWKKGKPVMANEYAINVQSYSGGNLAGAEMLAEKIARMLNNPLHCR